MISAISKAMPDGPQVREDGPEQRLLQELDPRRAAGALLAADGPLYQLDVPVTPFLQALVEVRHQLEQDAQVLPDPVQLQQLFQVLVAVPRRHPMMRQEGVEGVVDRRFLQSPLQALRRTRVVL